MFCRDDEVTTLPTRLCASSDTNASRADAAAPPADATTFVNPDAPLVKLIVMLHP